MQASLRFAPAPAAARVRGSQRGRSASNVTLSQQQPRKQEGRVTAANGVGRAGKRAALVAAALAAGSFVHPQAIVQTALGGGGNGLGGNGGGGWGGDHGWSRYFGVQPALALKDDDEELFDDDDKAGRGPTQGAAPASTEEDEQTFICESVKAVNLPTGPGIPTQVRGKCCEASLICETYRQCRESAGGCGESIRADLGKGPQHEPSGALPLRRRSSSTA